MGTNSSDRQVTAGAARRLLLAGQGLLEDPDRKATKASTYRVIRNLGYVQVDTISVVERAHHHILMTRLDGYRPEMLTGLLERERKLFEHWTHDASVIPATDFPFWRVRFERESERQRGRRRWNRLPEGEWERLIEQVRGRLRDEGPLRSADFKSGPGRSGGWWNWKPAKLVLEYLWRVGELSIHSRDGFQKVYDLTERVFPEALALPAPAAEEHLDWACRRALDRLGAATVAELRSFYEAVSTAEVREWCRRAVAAGRAVEVVLESEGEGRRVPGFALPDWRRRAQRAPRAPGRIRILSPFDPLVRNRERTSRVFGFDYRFEAFIPAAKRRYGYYVMPLLEGDRLVGRLDARLNRKEKQLEVRGLWWESGVEQAGQRRGMLEDAVSLYGRQVGAKTVIWNTARAVSEEQTP